MSLKVLSSKLFIMFFSLVTGHCGGLAFIESEVHS